MMTYMKNNKLENKRYEKETKGKWRGRVREGNFFPCLGHQMLGDSHELSRQRWGWGMCNAGFILTWMEGVMIVCNRRVDSLQ